VPLSSRECCSAKGQSEAYPDAAHPKARCCTTVVLAGLLALQLVCNAAPSTTRLTNDGRSYTRLGLGWSPDGSKILFSKQFREGKQLWVMNADGSDAKVISEIGFQGNYSWSPDGKKIGYGYTERREFEAEAKLLVYDLPSNRSVKLLSGQKWARFEGLTGWSKLVWTKDSKEFTIIMMRTAENRKRAESYLFDAETGECTALTPNNFTTAHMYPGLWSPDNSQFALASQASRDSYYRLWLCDRDGKNLRPITPKDWEITSDGLWSPDGKWIAFCTTYDRLEDEKIARLADLWLIRPDGREAHPITQGSSPATAKRMDFQYPEWTADGRYIVCQTTRFDENGRPYGGIYLVDVTTRELIKVLENDPDSDQLFIGYREKLDVSPDGRRLAVCVSQFTVRGRLGEKPTYEDERHILYYYDIPSRTLHEVQRCRPKEDRIALYSGGYSYRPFWSPKSDRLLFTKAKVIDYENWEFEPDIYIYQPEGAVTAGAEDTSTAPEAGAEANAAVGPTQTGQIEKGVTAILPVRNRDAVDIARLLPNQYDDMCKVDESTNAIIAFGPPEEIEPLKTEVAALDVIPTRVMVDILVIEMTKDGARELGLDWEYAHSHFHAVLPISAGLDVGKLIYQGVGRMDKKFFSTLSLAETRGTAKVQANPRVLATSGSESTVSIRRTKPFVFETGSDAYGRPIRARSDISADTMLKIKGTVLDGGLILLAIDATVDSFVFAGTSGMPDTTRRQVTTKLMCKDGESIVMGGLTVEELTYTENKTPLLGDLPLIGKLFRWNRRSKKYTDMAFLITPRIASDAQGGSIETESPSSLFKETSPETKERTHKGEEAVPKVEDGSH